MLKDFASSFKNTVNINCFSINKNGEAAQVDLSFDAEMITDVRIISHENNTAVGILERQRNDLHQGCRFLR